MENSKVALRVLSDFLEGLERNEVLVDVILFGGFLRRGTHANDLDILIVYDDLDHADDAKVCLGASIVKFPVDALFLHSQEVAEFGFLSALDSVALRSAHNAQEA